MAPSSTVDGEPRRPRRIAPYTLAFIGPHSSGSAASLRQALLSATFAKPPARIVGAGGTSTEISQSVLNSGSSPPITYISFGEDTKFEEDRLVEAFVCSAGSDADQTAILVEDNTVFGTANILEGSSPHSGRPVLPKIPLYIRFPREISLLRNAQIAQGLTPGSQVPSPYLSLSLKDPGADDTIPKFSSTQTPLSQEAAIDGDRTPVAGGAHPVHFLIASLEHT